jgi:hypothetical protein
MRITLNGVAAKENGRGTDYMEYYSVTPVSLQGGFVVCQSMLTTLFWLNSLISPAPQWACANYMTQHLYE